MNLGLAIFLSSIIIGLIFLFHSTKDRWNWKKITKWFGIIIFVVIVFIGLIILFKSNSANIFSRPSKVTSLFNIALGMNKNDVKFMRGVPNKIDSLKNKWYYSIKPDNYYRYRSNIFIKVSFDSKKVVSILYQGNGSYQPELFKRKFLGYNSQSLEDFLGVPSKISSSLDGLERIYSFEKYNLVFFLRENKVKYYGIYDNVFGTFNY